MPEQGIKQFRTENIFRGAFNEKLDRVGVNVSRRA